MRGVLKSFQLWTRKNPQPYNEIRSGQPTSNERGSKWIIKVQAHTTWNCKYHIVFAPKYRRQIIYGQIKADVGRILRQLCKRKGVEIIEATACPDHIHMLVSIPPKLSVSSFVGYLKGKSSLMIFDRHANLNTNMETGSFGVADIMQIQQEETEKSFRNI